MIRCFKSIKARKGKLSDYLNQKNFQKISISLGIGSIIFSDKARIPQFSPTDGIPPLDRVTVSGLDLPIYYTTDGTEPNINSASITSSPTTLTLTNLPLTLKARGSIGGELLGDTIESHYDRNPLIELNPSYTVSANMGVDSIRWTEMRNIFEESEESMATNMSIDTTRWEQINFLGHEIDETKSAHMSIDIIRWEYINIIDN